MNVVLIGSGNLATNVGKALKDNGHAILEVYSRKMHNAKKLADILDAKKYTDKLDDVSSAADIYVIAVVDSALENVIDTLCPSRKDRLFVHTAGSMPISVFEGKAQRYGILYPLQTFSKGREVDFKKIPCFIEGDSKETESEIESLCKGIFASVRSVPSDKRKYLHLAAVFGCNFVNHCFALCEQILNDADIPFEVMLPLIQETVDKVKVMSPRKAQTGPAVRYDKNVMNKHLRLLESKEMSDIYKLMSKSIHDMSSRLM